jgi:hypothetical protein
MKKSAAADAPTPTPDTAVRSIRWIAQDANGRELVVYSPTREKAQTLFEECRLLAGDFRIRRAGHIDTEGRLHIDDKPLSVVDRRITS